MTPAEIEFELSSLRARLLPLEDRERKRAEAWKSTHSIVRFFVIGFALVALGMLAFTMLTDRKDNEIAIALLLINIPLIFVGQTLMNGWVKGYPTRQGEDPGHRSITAAQ
jgi:hypothetical protein